mmetsp:Transcript_22571/g.74848  ORF Transcript_22571/g.74848 Transcript_22571/m.74848 type:complete len:625 (-) Transcript_22571:3786-5660(-)
MTPSSTRSTKRLDRAGPRSPLGPGCEMAMPSAFVSTERLSAQNVMRPSPVMLWSLAHAFMTAASLTQKTYIFSIPLALSCSSAAKYPGTWCPDQQGVKAPGRPMMRTFLPLISSATLTSFGGNCMPSQRTTLGIVSPALTDIFWPITRARATSGGADATGFTGAAPETAAASPLAPGRRRVAAEVHGDLLDDGADVGVRVREPPVAVPLVAEVRVGLLAERLEPEPRVHAPRLAPRDDVLALVLAELGRPGALALALARVADDGLGRDALLVVDAVRRPREAVVEDLRELLERRRVVVVELGRVRRLELDGVLELRRVQEQIADAGADVRELAEHDVRRDSVDVVGPRVDGALEEDLDRLLEGRGEERAGVAAVDAVAADGHERPAEAHGVAEHGEVAVVDVGAVEGDDLAEHLEQGLPRALDAHDVADLHDVVGARPRVVHVPVAQDGRQIRAVRLEHPLLVAAERARVRVPARHLRLLDVDLGHAGHAAQPQIAEHVALDAPEEGPLVVVDLGVAERRRGVVAARARAPRPDAHAEHELVRVVVGVDAVEVRAVLVGDRRRDVGHAELLVRDDLAVQLHAQDPGRHGLGVEVLVGHVAVGRDELPVVLDDRGSGVRVVDDLR